MHRPERFLGRKDSLPHLPGGGVSKGPLAVSHPGAGISSELMLLLKVASVTDRHGEREGWPSRPNQAPLRGAILQLQSTLQRHLRLSLGTGPLSLPASAAFSSLPQGPSQGHSLLLLSYTLSCTLRSASQTFYTQPATVLISRALILSQAFSLSFPPRSPDSI